MKRFLDLFRRNRPSTATARRPRSVRPTLESLEARDVPTVVAGLYANTSYELFNNDLWRHSGTDSNTGWQHITNGIAQVSIGKDFSGNEIQYLKYTNDAAIQHIGTDFGTGWYSLGENIKELSASIANPETVYIVYNDGSLYQHFGTDYNSGFSFINYDVAHVSAAQSGRGGIFTACFVQYNNSGVVDEYVGTPVGSGYSFSRYYVDYNAREISASQVEGDTLYEVDNVGNLWKHAGTDSNSGWSYLDYNVNHISAGTDGNGNSTVVALYNNGVVNEIFGNSLDSGHYYVDSNVREIAASQTQATTLYGVKTDGSAWEYPDTGGSQYYIWNGL
jgi:hypothetical protein